MIASLALVAAVLSQAVPDRPDLAPSVRGALQSGALTEQELLDLVRGEL